MSESGECIVRLDGEQVVIDRADPHVLISQELIDNPHPPACLLVGEGLVVIQGTNATVRYRLTNYDTSLRAWEAVRFA